MSFDVVREWLVASLLVFGALFVFLAAVGVYRLPDLFLRMQSVTKAATLGLSSMAIAVGIYFGRLESLIGGFLLVAFLFLTAPVAAQVIGRAAYRAGVPLWDGTRIDEWGRRRSAEASGEE